MINRKDRELIQYLFKIRAGDLEFLKPLCLYLDRSGHKQGSYIRLFGFWCGTSGSRFGWLNRKLVLKGASMSGEARCEVCGEPMPPGEEVFKYHGYSGPCPKEPLQRPKEDGFERFRQCVSDWRTKAKASEEEAGRIRSTVKAATDAEERCSVRAEVWEQCATDLEAAIKDSTNKSQDDV